MKKLILYLCVLFSLSACRASAADQAEDLKRSIAEAQEEKALAKGIESAGETFLNEHKFDAYVAFLRSLNRKDDLGKAVVNFSIGQTRLMQLKYLEESKQWDEYFKQQADLRKEAVAGLTEALKTSSPGNAVNLYANLILWQYLRDQQDPSEGERLAQLNKAIKGYAEAGKDPAPLKNTAEALASYGEKGKAKDTYALYFRKFSSGEGMTDEKLYGAAEGFLGEGNIDLAESAFDSYAERVRKLGKEKSGLALLQVARALAFNDTRANDPAYAEKMFAAAEAAGGKDIFDEETLYLRCLNLEQGQEMADAGKMYAALAERFAQGKYRRESLFKAGIISAYVRRYVAAARAYFGKLTDAQPPDSYAVSALYQLGLLKQWEGDTAAAKEFYTRTVSAAGEAFLETAALANKRLEEIDSSKPLDFPIKVFLDNSLGSSGSQFDMSKAEIRSPGSANKGEQYSVSSQAVPDPSGCTQVSLAYYWSGDLGAAQPGSEQTEFSTSSTEEGTKVVNLVVMSSNGVLDRSIKMINVK